jgi:hypothetical protein
MSPFPIRLYGVHNDDLTLKTLGYSLQTAVHEIWSTASGLLMDIITAGYIHYKKTDSRSLWPHPWLKSTYISNFDTRLSAGQRKG